ncbi:MAG: LegC family aminotransferase [bacterium]
MSSFLDQCQVIIDFIRDQFPNKDFIPLHEPSFNGNEKKYLADCIDSTFVSSVGKYVDQFEHMIASYTGVKFAIATVNGTAALHIALLLAGVEENTEVITQPLTFVATCNAIKYCGADPVFIDISQHTLGMCPEKLEIFLKSSTKKTAQGLLNIHTNKIIKACVPMHTFGHPVEIDKIVDVCDQFDIPVVEDSAESLGSLYKNKHTGTFGKLGVFSFNGNKIVTTGGGGMIVTDDEYLAKRAKHLTTTAKVPHQWDYVHDEIGYNYRMPNINAALGCAQMEHLDQLINIKRELAKTYQALFDDLDIKCVQEPDNTRSNYWLQTVLFNDQESRDIFLEMTNKQGVMTRPCWELMCQLEMFSDCYKSELMNSKDFALKLVNIPSSVVLC